MRTKEGVGVFSIAGVPIVVSGLPRRGLKVRNPLYHRFMLGELPSAHGPAITIAMKLSPPPALAGKEMVFDTRESWALFRVARRLWAVYHPPAHEKPFWVAGFDRRAARVDFYCPDPTDLIHPVGYPLDQLLLMYFLAKRQGILAHAAGLVLKGKTFLFAGASGAGKSTFSGLLVQAGFGKMLSDERMVVRRMAGEMTAFGTPWAGTAAIARNGSAPLAGIFFLKHGKGNAIKKLDAAVAVDRLLPLASIPWYDPDTAAPIIAFAKRIFAVVPAYEFSFTPDPAAIDFFREFIGKKS